MFLDFIYITFPSYVFLKFISQARAFVMLQIETKLRHSALIYPAIYWPACYHITGGFEQGGMVGRRGGGAGRYRAGRDVNGSVVSEENCLSYPPGHLRQLYIFVSMKPFHTSMSGNLLNRECSRRVWEGDFNQTLNSFRVREVKPETRKGFRFGFKESVNPPL